MAYHPRDLCAASAPPLAAMLASIPSMPRPILARLTARMIERLDEMDPDPDMEEDDPPELASLEWHNHARCDSVALSEDDEDGFDREGIDEREPENVC